MGSHTNGVNCGVVEWVKRNVLRWFGHIERMGSEEFVRKVHVSESVQTVEEGHLGVGGTVQKSTCVREVLPDWVQLDQARRECLDRERWRLFCRGHPLGMFVEEAGHQS